MKKAKFGWAEEKDKENQAKHGVPFATAQQSFLDPHRVIAEDMTHSSEEDRYYCIGGVGGRHRDGTVYLPRQYYPYLRGRVLEERKENV